jgi:nitrite reductase/ring-hydroxylating ferredoxin subunit/ferredoxin
MADNSSIESGWFALCDVDQLGERAIYHTELSGNELVVWRAQDGAINVWENRCPHRGVRLSMGHHRGDALQCQYHGWQFGSGDGACRFVPAHPDAAPPSVSVKRWPVEVRHGFVWTALAKPDEGLPPFTPVHELDNEVDVSQQIRLRTVAIDACSETVQRALAGYEFDHVTLDPWSNTGCVAFDAGPHAVVVTQLDDAQQGVVFLVQPTREGRTCLHGVALGVSARNGSERLAVQRHHQQRLNALRDALELQAEPPWSDTVTSQPTPSIPAALPSEKPVFFQPAASRPVSPARPLTAGFVISATADEVEDHAFTVHLARSEKTLTVPANANLLQTLRDHHVDVPTSCEQGVCGTCRTRVLEGTPLHRDDFLTPQERAAGDCMLVCVSRAAGAALTLDL